MGAGGANREDCRGRVGKEGGLGVRWQRGGIGEQGDLNFPLPVPGIPFPTPFIMASASLWIANCNIFAQRCKIFSCFSQFRGGDRGQEHRSIKWGKEVYGGQEQRGWGLGYPKNQG